ncbi:MAG TPA: hypothetical protein P5058_01965 [Eubacteriales bacterium]|jgi:hypothetical protein|nr:hypothetical protein [Eubacteriales bacterium]
MVTLKREEIAAEYDFDRDRFAERQSLYAARNGYAERLGFSARDFRSEAATDSRDVSLSDRLGSARRPLNNSDNLWERLSYTSPNRVTADDYKGKRFSENAFSADEEEYDVPTRNARRFEKNSRRTKMSLQGKVILAVYLILALVIASLIIVNAEVLNKTGAAAADIAPKATVEISEAYSDVEVSVEGSPYDYSESTNWFDKFCDGLSSLFGD